ncbi:MAG: fused MFS/spermidine synthase [Verrucomicrobia bacterium]|nr:fused MFS/spermidine synthase [Verrucomicrobiota bacterium]
MKTVRPHLLRILAASLLGSFPLRAGTVYEATSAYHHIRVLDEDSLRTLCFDDAEETRMSLRDPLKGHFEYSEYFHMPWLWNMQITNVLMVGLGGGSVQRSFEHYYPGTKLDTVEIDPAVAQVARKYFHFQESDSQKLHLEDGRMYLRRSQAHYQLIILDAYVQGRYGSSIPQHLATREFFELVRDHLTTNGVAAYNVIGTMEGSLPDIVGAIYRTLKSVFPQVYLFPARSSQNVVLIATKTGIKTELPLLRQRAAMLERTHRVTLPGFGQRVERFQGLPPPSAARSPILTDDYAPVESLVGGGQR